MTLSEIVRSENSLSDGGWVQTFLSNVNYDEQVNGSPIWYDTPMQERVDNGAGNPNPLSAEYFNSPPSNILSDQPGRLVNNKEIVWDAQSSVINNGNKIVSVTWGFTVNKNNTVTHRAPKIINETTLFHNTVISNLPK